MYARDGDTRPREQLTALFEIGRAVNSTLELREVLDRILGMTLDLFQAEAGSVMLLQDESLRIAAARGLPPDVVENTRVALGEGIAGWVASTGEMLLLNGKVADPRFQGVVNRSDDITSSLCTPLRSRDGTIGVMMVRRSGPTTFSRSQLDFFSSVADQAAMAIANARLFEQEHQRSRELELERQKFEAIFSAMADGVVVTDGAGEIRHANQAALAILAPEDPVGRRLADFFPTLPMEHLRVQVGEQGLPFEIEAPAAGGSESPIFRVTVSALGRPGQDFEGMVFLLHDVTERIRVERMKSEFLSAVSHELKTPLTTITGFMELMLVRDFPRPRQEHYLRVCLEEGGRLLRLIDDLLTLSRLESGRFGFHRRECRLETVLDRAMDGFRERFGQFEFRLQVEDALPPLLLDEDLVAQVLLNLLSNAVKYSPEGGTVEVTVRRDEDRVLVSVRDQGIGIPGDKIPFIFEKFYRVDNSLIRQTGGTGLGLANARYIVEGHGGTIWAESAPGEGSTFTFVLPLHPGPHELQE